MRKVALFKDRLKEAIQYRNLSQISLSRMTGISKSLLSKYLKGISEAGNDKLHLLASCLRVSPVWLMGYDVEMRDYIISTEKECLIKDITRILEIQDEETLKTFLEIISAITKKQSI